MAQGSRQVIHMGPIECCNNTRIPSQTASEAQRNPNKDLKKQNQDFFKSFLTMESRAGCGGAWLTISPSRLACLCDFVANLVYIVPEQPGLHSERLSQADKQTSRQEWNPGASHM